MKVSYWNNNSQYQKVSEALKKLIPHSGKVEKPRKNIELERFRRASNCYYDLYNNGLYNRAAEFAREFGIRSSYYKQGWGFADHLYELTEVEMNKKVLAAAEEQFGKDKTEWLMIE